MESKFGLKTHTSQIFRWKPPKERVRGPNFVRTGGECGSGTRLRSFRTIAHQYVFGSAYFFPSSVPCRDPPIPAVIMSLPYGWTHPLLQRLKPGTRSCQCNNLNISSTAPTLACYILALPTCNSDVHAAVLAINPCSRDDESCIRCHGRISHQLHRSRYFRC